MSPRWLVSVTRSVSSPPERLRSRATISCRGLSVSPTKTGARKRVLCSRKATIESSIDGDSVEAPTAVSEVSISPWASGRPKRVVLAYSTS